MFASTETRFVLARRRWPSTLLNLDLLRPARRVWTGWLSDCRLSTLESRVLGLERESDYNRVLSNSGGTPAQALPPGFRCRC